MLRCPHIILTMSCCYLPGSFSNPADGLVGTLPANPKPKTLNPIKSFEQVLCCEKGGLARETSILRNVNVELAVLPHGSYSLAGGHIGDHIGHRVYGLNCRIF